MPKRYRIGDVAKLIGVTPEAIRYYELRGLISPVRDAQSGYRYYGTWDIHMLKHARVLRQLGFSLEDSGTIMEQESDLGVIDFMGVREKEIEAEIQYKMALLRRVKDIQKELVDSSESVGTIRLEERPAFFRLHMQEGYVLEKSAESMKLMQEWMNYAPFMSSSALFRKDDLENPEATFSFGLIVEEGYAHSLRDTDSEFVTYYPPCACIYTSFISRDTKHLNISYLDYVKEYVKENGLEICGDILTRVVAMWKPEEEYFNCHQVWIPIC